MNQNAEAVEVELSDGTRASYDFVVGCDGSRSTVRSLAFSDVPEASFTGLAVWRATMPRHKDVDCMQMFYGPNTKAGVNPHSRDEMFLFLVQPIRDGQRLPPDQMHVLLAEQLRDFSGDVMLHAREWVNDPAKVDYRPMNSFLLPPPWHRGRVAVIGDAAHTTTPHLATGAGIAIEDAVVLAELLAADLSVAGAARSVHGTAICPLPAGRRDRRQARRNGKGQDHPDPGPFRPDVGHLSKACRADLIGTGPFHVAGGVR